MDKKEKERTMNENWKRKKEKNGSKNELKTMDRWSVNTYRIKWMKEWMESENEKEKRQL